VRGRLYEFAGSDAAFLALARAHHARCLADPEFRAAMRAYMES
jgi:hemoglobin